MFTLKQILISCYEFQIPVRMQFLLLFSKEIKSVEGFTRTRDAKTLKRMTLQETLNRVRSESRTSKDFSTISSSRNCDPLFTVPQRITGNRMRESKINRGGAISTKSHQ